MKKIDRRIAANGGQNVAVVGQFIWLKSATGAISIKTDRGETAFLTAGDFIRTDNPFTEFFISDESGAQNDVTFNISTQGEAGLYTKTVDLGVPGLLDDVADITLTAGVATLVLAADSTRYEAIITASAANANTTRVGSSSVAAARGTPLVAGASLIITSSAPIYAFNAAAEVMHVNYTRYA